MRTDANSISTNLVSQIVAAAHDFDCDVEGTQVHVAAKRGPGPALQSAAPLPAVVHLACSWSSGSVELVFCEDRWPQSGKVALKIALARAPQAQILWITLPTLIGDHADGDEVRIPASMSPFKRKGDGNIDAMATAMKEAFERSGIPKAKATDSRALAFTVKLPNLLTPSASEVFERLVKIALLKLPGFAREPGLIDGQLPYEVPKPSPAVFLVGASEEEEKFAGLGPLPGGVREYKTTADELLARIGGGCTRAELEAHLFTRYQITGKTALPGYIALLARLGLIKLDGKRVALGSNAAAYLPERKPMVLFRILDETFSGFLEMLVVAESMETFGDAESVTRFKQLLEVEWDSANQVNFRRNWLLSLGARMAMTR